MVKYRMIRNKKSRKTKSSTAMNTQELTKEVKTLKKKVKVQAPELYYWTRNSVLSATPISTTGSVHSLCLAKEEDDNATAGTPERIGNEITWVKAQWRGYLRWNASATLSGVVRLMVVLWKKQTTATYPTFGDIFEGSDANYGLTLDKKRVETNFRILLDKRYYEKDFSNETLININLDLKKIKSYYKGPLATDIQENGLYFMVQSNQGTHYPTMAINERIYYHQ